jgi:hypothetical protein
MSLDNPESIDLVGELSDVVTLYLFATEPWAPNGADILRLQAKLKSYVAFAADGQLTRMYPDVAGKKVVIEIRSDFELGETEMKFVAAAREHWCEPEGIGLVISALRDAV